MSRSGYSDDYEDNWRYICWRGAVASAIKGYKGQRFFKELLEALENMPNKRLISDSLVEDGEFCTLGVLGNKRGINIENLDPEDSETVANTFKIADALAREVVFINDEYGNCDETPEERYCRVIEWVRKQIIND